MPRTLRCPSCEIPSIQDRLKFFEHKQKDIVYGTMIPEPDYSDDESDSPKSKNGIVSRNNKANLFGGKLQKENKDDRFDQNGLIMPKKLVNPCCGSGDKMNLHKELMFNKKVGINVLNQKSELQKAMEKHKDKKALKEQEKEKQTQLTPLQKAIDERAQKLEKQKQEKTETEEDSSDFLKVQAKFRSKIGTK